MDSCHHHPLGPPIDIKGRTAHPEMDHLPKNLSNTKFAFKWNPMQFEKNKHLQMYEETNQSIFYLMSNTVKQVVSLKIYMILLICQDRPAGQNYHPTLLIKYEQFF